MNITIPSLPFCPWLRLAHRVGWKVSPATGSGTRRHLRDWQFLFQISGESWLWYEANGGCWPLRPGDLALVPPGPTYAWGLPVGTHIAVHFDLHAQPDLSAADMVVYGKGAVTPARLRTCPLLTIDLAGTRHDCLSVVRPPSPRRWQERFAPLLRQWKLREHHTPTARLAAAGILAESFAEWLDLARPTPPRDASARATVAALIERLGDAPPPRDLDVSGLARTSGLGETLFRSTFRRVAGRTPRAWLERRRIEHAARLLRDGGLSVAAAGQSVGYDDPFHFTRVFRRVMGCPPRTFLA